MKIYGVYRLSGAGDVMDVEVKVGGKGAGGGGGGEGWSLWS